MGVRFFGRSHRWPALVLLGLSCCALHAQQDASNEGRVPLQVSATDADGDTLKYEWAQVGGPKAFSDRDKQRFAGALDRWLSKAQRARSQASGGD